MRISKWIKPFCFLLILCMMNKILAFALEPNLGASDMMWSEYYAEDEIDTIFVGASVCSASFDPAVFNERLGVKSFNMATPSQAIEQTIYAVETALEDHQIKTVIFGMGFFTLKGDEVKAAELTFRNARNRKIGGMEGMVEQIKYMFSEGTIDAEASINYMFPWTYNHVEMNWESISNNIVAKLSSEEERFDVSSDERKSWILENGYRPYTGVVNYDEIWANNSYYIYSPKLEEYEMQKLEQLINLCNENNVELIIVNIPHPVHDVIACSDSYAQENEEVAALCESYGVDYYNFNLAKEEIYEAMPEYYYDFEHLNYTGSQVFSENFCDFLERRATGEDMDTYFYSVEEFMTIHNELLEEWKNVKEFIE